MQYLLMIYEDESQRANWTEATINQTLSAYYAYTDALQSAGHLLGGNRLRPVATATSVRVVDGKNQVLDGPYAETREQLGGYYLIDVPDLDQAISWAARCHGANIGTIEVRPIWPVAEER